MEPSATPSPPRARVASDQALKLVAQVNIALGQGNVAEARTCAHTARLLYRKRTTPFPPKDAALVMLANGRSLHARALLLQQTSERDAEVQLSIKQSPGLLRQTSSRLRQAMTLLNDSSSSNILLIAQVQSMQGLVQYDISQQGAQSLKDGRIKRLRRKKRAKLRQQGLDKMRAAVEQLRAHPQPATSRQSLEVYLNLVSCCGVLERGRYIVEAIEQCDDLGISRKYALAHLLGRRAITKSLAKFYAAHTPVPAPKETTP